IVVEAGGNGDENFDDISIYDQLFDTTYRNSHAIIVGAGAPPGGVFGLDRSRMDFSNYGARINLQGYGHGVYTTGYGELFDGGGDPDQYYTADFNGTSAASPIVAGAVACLQGYYKLNYGAVMTSDYARDILITTGSPQQGSPEHIGPRPDLQAAIAALSPPPSLYSEPIYIDTSLEPNSIGNATVWLYNRSGTYGIDFSITANDSITKSTETDWLDATPLSGTVPAEDSVDITVTLDGSLLEPALTVYKGELEIAWGVAGGVLDSLSCIPVFLSIPCQPDTVYDVAASTDVGGPDYEWIEITGIGTMIPHYWYYNPSAPGGVLDDGTAGPIVLPFDFPFYGGSYDKVYVGVNGAVSFTETELNLDGYYSDLDIPGNHFTTFVAPFWSDLIIGDGLVGHGDIYHYSTPTDDTIIIQWNQVGNFDSINDTLTTFQVILTRTGDITFQYLSVGTSGLENRALVGINAYGCQAISYLDDAEPAEHMIGNETAVRFDSGIELVMAGDPDDSGGINLLDILFLISFLYSDPPGPEPDPYASGDVDCNDSVNLLDILFLIDNVYMDGDDPCYYVPIP
ncbi:MAG: S8 family serine peptidase, partial [Candidatus Zixiibacteriota bacterium]